MSGYGESRLYKETLGVMKVPLASELVSQFVKSTRDTTQKQTETTVHGTTVMYNGRLYVRLDGSDLLTPVSTTADVAPDERVNVMIKNHTATVTGNISSPSARTDDVQEIGGKVEEAAKEITEFQIVMAGKVTATDLEAINATIESLKATVANIDNLEAINADIENLQAKYAKLEYVDADTINALNADIDNLVARIAEIGDLSAEDLEAINADIDNLKAYNADFTYVSADVLEAIKANIKELDVKKLSATEAELKYANIDFANIGEAAIENFFSKSGIIGDLVVDDGHVTGTLVGVTIKGDLIEGGTVVADKLVIKGDDGLYYKLNTDGETVAAEQTEYNSLSGSIITAKSVTAEKINVSDLVAFDATIGGFNITDDALYSGVKESVDNTTRGVYLDSTGQVAFGDQSNFLKYFKDDDGNWKLEISAGSIKFGTSNKSVEEAFNDTMVSSVEQFYQSDSPVSLTGGSWSIEQPTWTEGKYIWRRTAVTYGDGSSEYTPSATGVCITGNTGEKGEQGEKGNDGTGVTILGSYDTEEELISAHPTGNEGDSYIVAGDLYVWDATKSSWINVGRIQGPQGDQGFQGEQGEKGEDGNGVENSEVRYQASTSGTTIPTGSWVSNIPNVSAGQYLWTRTILTYTDGSTTTSYSVGKMGLNGASGNDGIGVESYDITYQAGSSQIIAPTGEWSSSIPELSPALPYLWTRTILTYTDDSASTSYSVSSTLESFEVGGRNLIIRGTETIDTYIDSSGNVVTQSGYATSDYIPITPNIDYMFSRTESTVSDGGYFRYAWYDESQTYIGGDSAADLIFGRTSPSTAHYVRISHPSDCQVKFERGNKATDWTPAPEDVQEGIDNAQDSADEANDGLDDANNRLDTAESTIELLNDSISMLITDENGESMMTQTSDGWRFDISNITNSLEDARETVDNLSGSVGNLNSTVKNLDQLIDDITKKTAYIIMATDDEGNPCIELGKEDNPFKVRITNTSVDFMEGTSRIAYVSNKRLFIETAIIKNELQIGEGNGFVWKRRSNGNMGLRWIGGAD